MELGQGIHCSVRDGDLLDYENHNIWPILVIIVLQNYSRHVYALAYRYLISEILEMEGEVEVVEDARFIVSDPTDQAFPGVNELGTLHHDYPSVTLALLNLIHLYVDNEEPFLLTGVVHL